MNTILNREDFINEIYNPMNEEKEYRELQMINEGLLKNIFGKIKNLFTDDWKKIKGNDDIIKAYKEIDDKLTGFTTMKISKRDQCNKIRQELVTFAEIWYEKKKNKTKDSAPKMAKSMKFKDEALAENLEKCENVIKEIADNDSELIKWSNILKDDMTIVINNTISKEIDDENIKNEIEEQNKKKLKELEENNKKVEKIQNERLKKIDKERTEFIKNVGSEPMNGLLADKAIVNIYKKFEENKGGKNNDNIYNKAEKAKTFCENDKLTGLNKIYDDDSFNEDNFKHFKTSYLLMSSFYDNLNNEKTIKKFENTSGTSTQAMCIAVNSFIKACEYGFDNYPKQLELMARCAIVSDGTIGYNLPLNDKGDGNIFTDYVTSFTDENIVKKWLSAEWDKVKRKLKIDNKEKPEISDDFKKNAKTLINKIQSEAKKLTEKAKKEYDSKMND